jgi:hypothetical protein
VDLKYTRHFFPGLSAHASCSRERQAHEERGFFIAEPNTDDVCRLLTIIVIVKRSRSCTFISLSKRMTSSLLRQRRTGSHRPQDVVDCLAGLGGVGFVV